MTSRPFRLFCLATALFLSGCAIAPTQEMSDARQAVQAAREANAEQHAQSALTQAERLLITAEENLGRKTYNHARDNAVAAKAQAIAARHLALAIGDAKESIAKAAAQGITSSKATTWLMRAEAFAESGDIDSALDAAERAKAQAERDISAADKTP